MSTLTATVIKAMYSILTDATSSDSLLDSVPLYHDHAPADLDVGNGSPYPLITYSVRQDTPFASMKADGERPNRYTIVPIRVTVFASEDDFANGMDIMSAITEVVDFYDVTTLNDANFMGFYPNGGTITFFDSENKLWNFSQEWKVWIGE